MFSFIIISPYVLAQACDAPFIDCNGLCTLPSECQSGGTPVGGSAGSGGTPVGGGAGGGGTPVGGGAGGGFTLTNPIQSSTFAGVMQKVAEVAAKIGLPLVVVFMIYAGFLFVSARGNEEKLTSAKNTFFWAVVGALLVVGAYAIATAIQQFAKQL